MGTGKLDKDRNKLEKVLLEKQNALFNHVIRQKGFPPRDGTRLEIRIMPDWNETQIIMPVLTRLEKEKQVKGERDKELNVLILWREVNVAEPMTKLMNANIRHMVY